MVTDNRRILLVTFYYAPDLSAGSFRTAALVRALLAHPVTIDVVTTLPHRYHSYAMDAPEHETDSRVTIHRIKLPSHKSGMIDQALAFAHYARVASRLQGRYDLVVATSGRLMTATLGAWLARKLRAPLYLDVRDLFADNLKYIMPRFVSAFVQPLFSALERWAFRRAAHINLVSRGFEPYIRSRYPEQSLSYFTNGVDEEFTGAGCVRHPARGSDDGPLTVLYAGNIGEAQGLHVIVPPLARRLNGRVSFRLIGDGGRRPQLELILAQLGIRNVTVVPPMPREALMKEYAAADVLFLQLNDYEAFKAVLPSKIFEYAALGKPIWAGVAGYPARFLREEVSNVAVFPPCDLEAALEAFTRLELRDLPRTAFVEKYDRRAIMTAMAADIMLHANGAAARRPL